MSKTKIEWADKSWNPVTGCTKISEGCKNCYAERMSKRLVGRCGYPADNPFKVTLHPERLDEPLRWKKPSRIFVCSMGDLFHEDAEPSFIQDVFWKMEECSQHIFMVLTKRPERMRKLLHVFYKGSQRTLPKYIWLGVTAENQEQADKRIPILLQIPAAVRFVSVEPMLGPVDLTKLTLPDEYQPPHVIYPSLVGFRFDALKENEDYMYQSHNHLDWVICGGESGPNARPMQPDWARNLRDQCKAAGVPFLFKQWGEWLPQKEWLESEAEPDKERKWIRVDGRRMFRVGKAKAGRLLDGQLWDEYPEVQS